MKTDEFRRFYLKCAAEDLEWARPGPENAARIWNNLVYLIATRHRVP